MTVFPAASRPLVVCSLHIPCLEDRLAIKNYEYSYEMRFKCPGCPEINSFPIKSDSPNLTTDDLFQEAAKKKIWCDSGCGWHGSIEYVELLGTTLWRFVR